MRCRLSSDDSPKWKFIEILNYTFKRYSGREALALENKIVFFGCNYITFELEKCEKREQLKVVRKS